MFLLEKQLRIVVTFFVHQPIITALDKLDIVFLNMSVTVIDDLSV